LILFKEGCTPSSEFAVRIHNPILMSLLSFVHHESAKWHKDIVVTSFHREDNDPYGMHKANRAVDIRIYTEERGIAKSRHDSGMGIDTAHFIKHEVDRIYQYEKNDGSLSSCCHIVGEGVDIHMHLQAPNIKQWSSTR